MKKIILAAAIFFCTTCAPAIGVQAKELSVGDDPYDALQTVTEKYGVKDARDEFELEQTVDVAYGTVYRFRRVKDGAEVYGEYCNLSTDRNGTVLSATCNYRPIGSLPAPKIDLNEAEAIATRDYEGAVSVTPAILNDRGAEACYKVETVTDEAELLFLSAEDGSLLKRVPLSSPVMVSSTQTDALGEEVEVDIDYSDNQYYLRDTDRHIYLFDAQGSYNAALPIRSSRKTFSDSIAVSAYSALIKAYDFYTVEENTGAVRYGINGKNDGQHVGEEYTLNVSVHYGRAWENASFTPRGDYMGMILIGDGSSSPNSTLLDPAKAADVLAHEYQHGITTSIANLTNENDAGAINEAISDIFGALITGKDLSDADFWGMGEGSVPHATYLRSMAGKLSESDDQRFTVQTRYPRCTLQGDHANHRNCDYGGVHLNSTILTHLQYKLWKEQPAFFTKQEIGRLWFATLAELTPEATFSDFASAFYGAAEKLGYPEEVLTSVHDCLFTSGLIQDDTLRKVTYYALSERDLNPYWEGVAPVGGAAKLPPEPTREDSVKYRYTFREWSDPLTNVTADISVTAQYNEIVREFKVTFVDEDGNPFNEQTVEYGAAAIEPDPPAKESDLLYDYDFMGWTRSFSQVTEDLTVSPRYRSVRCYQVQYYNGEDLLVQVRVRENESATPPPDPVKKSDEQYDYVFTGWDVEADQVTANMEIHAVYQAVPRQYTATYLSDGEVYATETFAFGESPTLLPDKIPQKDGYRFDGWYLDEAGTSPAEGAEGNFTNDITLYAKWTKEDGCSSTVSGWSALLLLLFLPPLLLVKRKHD